MPLIKVNMQSGAIALVPQQEVQSTNSVQDVAPYIRTSGEREREREREKISNHCYIDIQGRFKINLLLNCISLI